MISEKDYFSWENFNGVAQIDGHMKFTEQLMQKYQWTDEERKPLVEALNRIKEKQKDRCLNISVVGEFSSGKSTFINALLRLDLLEANVLQGTTVAITILEYSPKYQIRIEYEDGYTTTKKYLVLYTLRLDLIDLTTNPKEGKRLRCVYVGLPSPTLQKGYRIIDTPGTNAIDLWHEDVTRRAINEYSDMSILVTDAIKPLPKSMTTFAQQYLADSISTSVVVVTKLDLVRERERERQKTYIQKRVEHEYGDKAPLVVYYTSIEVLNTFVHGTLEKSNANLLKATLKSEDHLLQHTAQLRLRTQARRLLHLTSEMYGILTKQLEEEELDILIEKEELEKAKHADFNEFITKQKQKHRKRFEKKAGDISKKLRSDLYNMSEKSKQNILIKIQDQKIPSKIRDYVKDSMRTDCIQESELLSKKASKSYADLMAFARNEMRNFQNEFEHEFENLQLLRFNLKYIGNKKALTLPRPNHVTGFSTEKYLKTEAAKEDIAFYGGAVAGAVLGTSVLPVVGTIIGGIIGFMGGGFFSPSTEKVKNETLKKVNQPLNNYFLQVSRTIETQFDNYVTVAVGELENEIEKYHKQYWQEVKKYEDDLFYRMKKVNAQIEKLRIDQANLKQRQDNLKILKNNILKT